MTLRELLKSLNLNIAEHSTVQNLKIVNVDNFCLFNLLEYLRSDKLKEDLVTCSADIDEAEQLGRNPTLYFTHECKNGKIAITMKVCDSIDSNN